MKVLFCIDGTEASFYVVKKALPFLLPDYEIDLLNVIDINILDTYITFPVDKEEAFPQYKNISQEILDKIKKIIETDSRKINKSYSIKGHPADVILESIDSENYNIVVLGSHRKKGLQKWLGSVSRKVVSKSPVPTFIVRSEDEIENLSSEKIKQVLFTVDGSYYSYKAIEEALNILNMKNSSVEILTVRSEAESLPTEIIRDKEWLENILNKEKEIANETIEESKKILQQYNIIPSSTLSLDGDAAKVILDYTETNKKDLIIMGSHGRTGISDLLLGSVSKRVLDHAKSPVLIIPVKKKESAK